VASQTNHQRSLLPLGRQAGGSSIAATSPE